MKHMAPTAFPEVAVLLATYNGSRYIWEQIRSLADNTTSFTLHWLDDKSTDNTEDAVRKCAKAAKIALREWHHQKHLGVPGTFFYLLECVEADIYLFCDQDDIWEAGKLDATVRFLQKHGSTPTLAFTGACIFDQDQPAMLKRPVDFSPEGQMARLVQKAQLFAFMPGCPPAKTQGFTRSLRDLFLLHKDIAQEYAAYHDWWIYDIATASADIALLAEAPGVLHRRHSQNLCGKVLQTEKRWPYRTWHQNKLLRKMTARHAQGLLMAAETLPSGDRLDRMVELARMMACLERRQSPFAALRLARFGIVHAGSPTSMALNCLMANV